VAKVEKNELEGVEPMVLAEMQYVKAAGAARVALETGAKVDEANALVAGFLAKNPQSHHTYEMQELLGDLLGQAGKSGPAGEAYAQLAKGPPAFRIRAATANARLAFDQGKYDDAIRAYDNALQIAADDEASLAQKQAASLGKARSLAQAGKHADALELVQKIIKDADPEAKEMLARAYATLGAVYRSIGDKDQDAVISYLMVDLVYNTVPECHAEALYNLAELWEKGKNPERARQARDSLSASYPASPWKRKLDAPAKAS
jgi:tetratricopeptide (TPR) repeat protein